MFEKIRYIIKKEFIQVLRDNRMRAVVFLVPLIQLIIFANCANLDVRNINTVVLDRAITPQSREIIARIISSGYFNVIGYLQDEKEGADYLDYGDATVFIKFDPDFSKNIKKGKTSDFQIIVDGTNSAVVSVVIGYLTSIVENYSLELMKESYNISSLSLPGIVSDTRAFFNPGLKSSLFYIPGIMTTLILVIGLSLTSMAIVWEKERGTLEQIIVSPITPREFILGKTIPFIVMTFIAINLQMIIALTIFHLPLRGNLFILYLGVLFYLTSVLGIGIFISTICATRQQAMLSSFFFIMPAILLSGFMFPISAMPEIIQYFTYLNPARYFLEIARSIFLKGSPFIDLWQDFAALLVLGMVIQFLSIKRFKKKLG